MFDQFIEKKLFKTKTVTWLWLVNIRLKIKTNNTTLTGIPSGIPPWL